MSTPDTQPQQEPSREPYASVEAIGALERQLAEQQRDFAGFKELNKGSWNAAQDTLNALHTRVKDLEDAIDALDKRVTAFLQTPAAQNG